MTRERLYLYDTTLRDGQQTQGVQFSTAEKITIATALDTLGWITSRAAGPARTRRIVPFRRSTDHAGEDDGLWHDQAQRHVGAER